MRFSLHVGPTSCYYKSHGVNCPLIDFYLVWLSLLKSPALVNDYWTVHVINTTVTEGSKHLLPGGGATATHNKLGVCHFDQKSSTQKSGNLPEIDTQKSGNQNTRLSF